MKPRQAFSLVLWLLVIWVPACGYQTKPPETAAAIAPPVRVAKVRKADVPRMIDTVGTAKPSISVHVRGRVDGLIKKVHFTEGAEVREGQLLYEVDSESYESGLKEAQATLEASIAHQKLTLIEKDRAEKLSKAGASPVEVFEKARASYENAVAAVARDMAKRDVARLNLGYCKVTAPISGIAGKMETDGGSLTRGYDPRPVITINHSRPVYVEFALPEKLLSQVRAAARGPEPFRVEIRKTSQSKPLLGTVNFIDNQVDQPTGTITLRSEFPNLDSAIWPGEFFEVTVILSIDKGVLTMPLGALGQGTQGSHAYVLQNDNTVRLRQIKTRRIDRDLVLLDEGLKEGELVVTEGVVRLLDGMKVHLLDNQGGP